MAHHLNGDSNETNFVTDRSVHRRQRRVGKPDTVTLSVPGMNCAVCPITVGKALERVAGVSTAKVDYDTKTAVVTFDDTSTSVKQLMNATANVGYPSQVVKAEKAEGGS